MERVAYIFPGQGSQYVGMGKELYESHPEAKEVFDSADKILKFELTKLCFEGPKEELILTSNCQVAILVHSIAALRVLEKMIQQDPGSGVTQPAGEVSAETSEKPETLQYAPAFALGLSLGEYSALIAAECLSLEDGIKLIRKRGQFMQQASEKNPGAMASIMGMDMPQLEKLCKGFGCEIANINCPGQVVISGSKSSVELTANMAKEKGAKRAIALEVSGAFHSSLMTTAKEKLEKEIDSVTFNAPKYPIVSNVTGESTQDPEEIKENLITQVNSRTLWEASVKHVASQGIKTYLEIGPGSVLKGLLRKIDKSLNVINFEKTTDFSTSEPPQVPTG
ncbi:MAG: ACP S-malonyltransferase [Candidatus Omnitrophota bacterium]